jgi:hypothetical protein
LSHPVATVGDDRVDPASDALFSNLVFDAVDAAELDTSRSSRFIRWHACAKILFD